MEALYLYVHLLCLLMISVATQRSNGFDCWEVILAALPKEDNAKFRNIHFVCASNRLTFLEMADEIVKQLLLLEEKVFLSMDEDVYVVAPLFCFIADNPRHSEITSHLTGSPRKYCCLCLVRILFAYDNTLQKKE